jgi:signal transduction histidine kinase
VNLNQLAGQMVDEMRLLAEEKEIALNLSATSPDIILDADPKKLKWLLNNLIDNAIKFTPAGGSVGVQLGLDTADGKQSVLIQVTDTGIGIPIDERERLFDRFYRVDSAHTIPGTGLGLSIVKEIVTAHGGSISVTNSPDGGSTFSVSLPL